MKNQSTQLVDAVRCLLEISIEPMSEYQLIQLLKDQGWELPTNASDSLALFTSHFLLFNALYVLQDEFWSQHRYLEVSALKIVLHQATKSQDKNDSSTSLRYSADQSLRAYYLDLSELRAATSESVNTLLNQFWDKYSADDKRVEALSVFSLPVSTTYSDIKKSYRRLAMLHHPDRGGDAHIFQSINRAFGVLQRLYH